MNSLYISKYIYKAAITSLESNRRFKYVIISEIVYRYLPIYWPVLSHLLERTLQQIVEVAIDLVGNLCLLMSSQTLHS